MRKMMFLVPAMIFVCCTMSFAIETNSEDLLSLIDLSPATATQTKVSALFGMPEKVEESRKRTTWYYTNGTATLSICWDAKSALLQKFSFSNEVVQKQVFDTRLSAKLKSGATDVIQVLKLLGTPKDMTIKKATQEMHYAYAHNVLRLFFRDRVLVDYCLY